MFNTLKTTANIQRESFEHIAAPARTPHGQNVVVEKHLLSEYVFSTNHYVKLMGHKQQMYVKPHAMRTGKNGRRITRGRLPDTGFARILCSFLPVPGLVQRVTVTCSSSATSWNGPRVADHQEPECRGAWPRVGCGSASEQRACDTGTRQRPAPPPATG